MIVRLFLQVLLRGLATRNDRFQGNNLVVFDEWHKVHLLVALDDEDPLTAISLLVGSGVQECPARALVQ
jgi:hypothetical protein